MVMVATNHSVDVISKLDRLVSIAKYLQNRMILAEHEKLISSYVNQHTYVSAEN